ncbi:MAG: hypothetical protein V1897_19610, partial [Pseudomonadota bacterium]
TNGDTLVQRATLSLIFFRRNWARLIQKIYEVDPLVCPKCKGAMRISSIEDPSVFRVPRSPGHLARQDKTAAENH